jgi:predicted RNA polymerase sigma factor
MQTADNPVVALNHAVAVAMAQGPRAGLGLLVKLQEDERLAGDHRIHAVRAHLLEMSGEHVAARDSYLVAARQASNLSQQRYLYARAASLASDQ